MGITRQGEKNRHMRRDGSWPGEVSRMQCEWEGRKGEALASPVYISFYFVTECAPGPLSLYLPAVRFTDELQAPQPYNRTLDRA